MCSKVAKTLKSLILLVLVFLAAFSYANCEPQKHRMQVAEDYLHLLKYRQDTSKSDYIQALEVHNKVEQDLVECLSSKKQCLIPPLPFNNEDCHDTE